MVFTFSHTDGVVIKIEKSGSNFDKLTNLFLFNISVIKSRLEFSKMHYVVSKKISFSLFSNEGVITGIQKPSCSIRYLSTLLLF